MLFNPYFSRMETYFLFRIIELVKCGYSFFLYFLKSYVFDTLFVEPVVKY